MNTTKNKTPESVKKTDTSKPFVEKCRDLTNDKYDHSTAALMEKYNREMLALLRKEIANERHLRHW